MVYNVFKPSEWGCEKLKPTLTYREKYIIFRCLYKGIQTQYSNIHRPCIEGFLYCEKIEKPSYKGRRLGGNVDRISLSNLVEMVQVLLPHILMYEAQLEEAQHTHVFDFHQEYFGSLALLGKAPKYDAFYLHLVDFDPCLGKLQLEQSQLYSAK